MEFVLEIVCRGPAAEARPAMRWFESGPKSDWTDLPGLSAFDLYTPVEDGAYDPFVDDGPGPILIAMLAFDEHDALLRALASPRLGEALADRPAGLDLTGETMERRYYPVGGQAEPPPLVAPFSYVVRYHLPAEDEAAFVANYIATHPPTLAQLPGIRSILCYFPLRLGGPAILPEAGYMIGNEVAFDSLEGFNLAMASPVREELRRHYREFPRFSGRNTHYPMMRIRLSG